MKELRFRFYIILGAVALSIYLLYYNYANYQNNKKIDSIIETTKKEILQKNPGIKPDKLQAILNSKEDSIKNVDNDYAKIKSKSLKLGLDLQGGLYIVMEVNTAKLMEKLAKNPDANFNQALRQAEQQTKFSNDDVVSLLAQNLQSKGIRLSRYFGRMKDDDDELISSLKNQAEDAVSRAIEIIRNRVDQYGVSEPTIQRQGSRRIVVELPGISNEEEAKSLLQGQALLEFKLVKEPQFAGAIMTKIDEALAGRTIADSSAVDSASLAGDTSGISKDTAEAQLSKEEQAKRHPFFSLLTLFSQGGDPAISEENKPKLEALLARPEVQNVLPDNVQFLYSAKPFLAEGTNYYFIHLVNKEPELTGGYITDAQSNIDPQSSSPIVYMKMNSEGAREWARITGSNIDKRIAIVLDNYVYSAPVVRNKISGGSSQIEGMKDLQEAKLLEIVLKAGALPAPIDIIEQRTVGASLGEDSIDKGFNSGLLGFILVVIFMVVYYQKSGGIAGFSLIFTVIFILAALSGFNATLTLPGIAGIVLAIGMAVDSNVLIYERIREEIAVGKTMRSAITSGFSSSFSAIFDSNVTTLITGVILYNFGSGPIQGFAVTLMIGIVASLFSSLVITRVIFDYMAGKGYDISIG